jgi:hypothetical protein
MKVTLRANILKGKTDTLQNINVNVAAIDRHDRANSSTYRSPKVTCVFHADFGLKIPKSGVLSSPSPPP